MSKLKVFFVLALMIAALVVTAFSAETVIYQNDFSDASTLSDFKEYRSEWEIRDGALYMTDTAIGTAASEHFSHLVYQGTNDLSNYIIDVDMKNVQASAGVLFNVQRDSVGSGTNAFYGYTCNISKAADIIAFGSANSSGGWKGNIYAPLATGDVNPGINVHFTVIVKNGYIGINAYNIDTKQTLCSYSYQKGTSSNDQNWGAGTFGFRVLKNVGSSRVNANNMQIDNLVVTTANETSVSDVVNRTQHSIVEKKINTDHLIPVYTNTFDSSASISDFEQYYGVWEVKDGRLYLKSQTSGAKRALLMFNGDDAVTSLTDYVVDVDLYTSEPYGGIIARADTDKISGTGNGNDFFGYMGFIDVTAEKAAVATSTADGSGIGLFTRSKNVTSLYTNLHLQIAVKGSVATYNVYDLDRNRIMWSSTNANPDLADGSFGLCMYSPSGRSTAYFDNLVLSVYDENPKEEPQYSGATFTNPVAPGADPFVLKDDDGTYYLYGSGGDSYGYRVYSSKNLVEWTSHGYCLHFEDEDVFYDTESTYQQNKLFWAPEVIKYNGKYYMTVSFQHHLNFAVADSPLGPFKTIGEDILFPGIDTIDGHFFLENGVMYFYFVTEGAATINGFTVSVGNNIWGSVLDMETMKLQASSIKLLLEFDTEYERNTRVVEGPFVIKNNGKYYLTFSSTGYKTPDYSVHYATSTSPLASYTRDARNVVLKTVDLEYDDTDNPNLYGSGHHSFVEAPNGKDMLIIYHCHRTNKTWNSVSDLCSPRSVCVDYAWFEGDWLLAGSAENRTVPTAVPQPILEGTVLERETYYKGEYTALASLPTVYVANTDGLDTNTGEKTSPVATISRATALLPNGGTIVLMQNYNSGSLITLSSGDKPLLITAEHNNVIWEFKCIRINSDVYIDNIIFAPIAANDVAVIECNFNNVIIGEGVSCINRPFGEREFPYLVGGRWKYGGSLSTTYPYRVFNYDATLLSSDSEYTLTVIGGTWEMVEACSVSYRTPIADSTPNASLVRTNVNLETWGDVNYDGSVTLADAVLAIKSALDGGFNKRIDFNYDKTVTLLDVVRLLKLI